MNTTISGNYHSGCAGGVYLNSFSSANIFNSTIVGNASGQNAAGMDFQGEAHFYNTVVAGNVSGENASPMLDQAFAAGGVVWDVGPHPMTRDAEVATILAYNSAFSSQVVVTEGANNAFNLPSGVLGLADLANNTGFGLTHAISADSVLRNNGSNDRLPVDVYDLNDNQNVTERLPVDATGRSRITSVGSDVDIGAYEYGNAPRLQNALTSLTYLEGAVVQLAPNITVSDVEHEATHYQGFSIGVMRKNDSHEDDLFSLATSLTYTMTDAAILKNGVAIASLDRSTVGALIITFTAELTASDVTDVVQLLSYSNTSDDLAASFVLTLTAMDSDGEYTAIDIRVATQAVNDAPTLTATGVQSAEMTPGSEAVSLFSQASVSAVEEGQLITRVILTVSGIRDAEDEALLIDGSVLTLQNGLTLVTSQNSVTLSISDTGGILSVSMAQNNGLSAETIATILNGMQYVHNAEIPSEGMRFFSLSSVKDNGGTSNGGVDTKLLSIHASVNVVIPNAAPQISGTPSTSVEAGSAYSFTPTASDPEGATLTYTISNRPSWASFIMSTGRLSGTPTAEHVGTSSNIVISVSDGELSASLPPFSIAVVDTQAPSGHSVQFSATSYTTDQVSFAFAGAEIGASYRYVITSSEGTETVEGTGTIGSAADTVSHIDVSGLDDGTLTLSVVLTDAFDNAAAAVQAQTLLDRQAPTVTLTAPASGYVAGDFTLQLVFSESVSGFGANDLEITNGSAMNVSTSNLLEYSVLISPDEPGEVTMQLSAGAVVDRADNSNEASQSVSVIFDATAPVPVISSTHTSPTNSDSFVASIQFGERVEGFLLSDIIVQNATVGSFVDHDGASFSVLVTPVDDDEIVLSLASGAAQDLAGNDSEATEWSIVYDGTRPGLISVTPAAGATNVATDTALVLTFDENVFEGEGHIHLFKANDELVESFFLTQEMIQDNVMTLQPNDLLVPAQTYYVLVANNAVRDEAHNTYVGIEGEMAWRFTVANAAPVANADTVSTDEDVAVQISVLANDTDADSQINPASVLVVQAPAHGSVTLNTANGVLTYTPATNFNGSDSFTYTVEDLAGAVSEAALVSITVTAVNDAPVAVADVATTPEDHAIEIDVLANDTDVDMADLTPDTLDSESIVIVAQPEEGVAEVVDGKVLYTPKRDFNGIPCVMPLVLYRTWRG